MCDDNFDKFTSFAYSDYTDEDDDPHQHDDVEGSYLSDLYVENIEEFTGECLQSYFIENKLLAKPALDALTEARNLISLNTTASFLFAAIAIEVGLKTTIYKPIVYGLVHTESVAVLITDLTISGPRMSSYKKLLSHILKKHGGVDLDSFKRLGSNKILWEEIRDVKKIRDLIMHRAESASKQSADLALCVASEILETIFPAVLMKVGFHLHEGYRICNKGSCKIEK